jgi:hypothetical protein
VTMGDVSATSVQHQCHIRRIANALNELRILASFQHPRILRFYEAFIGK